MPAVRAWRKHKCLPLVEQRADLLINHKDACSSGRHGCDVLGKAWEWQGGKGSRGHLRPTHSGQSGSNSTTASGECKVRWAAKGPCDFQLAAGRAPGASQCPLLGFPCCRYLRKARCPWPNNASSCFC